ncbi:K(+)-stimulated pyrophosphate-energized sodium pump [Methylomarinovum caldicuralii]|uniref:K(+)-insensitive pyrophosphate-energized proton pump n=1 Tax=Methylomarinovum caldicuralii TaxID=438856 RepID=A0AAU9C9H6_9GAMM|nr:sodium-translocating pyrophosphatase [Methylomarinovum caldicuralii]BCX82206.1 K(+)-stimulated pyrophosphate-energized sodium pump [Methylomarinovum caldicuralii]
MHWSLQLTLIATALGCLYALGCALWILRQPEGDTALQRPYLAIREGAAAFMRIQYGTIAAVGAVIFALLWWIPRFGPVTAWGFALGGIGSALAGLIGMTVAVRANVRTAAAAQTHLGRALQIAYRSGAVTGFLLGSLALAAVLGFHLWLQARGESLAPLAGLGFGASLISIFSRLGGGIFTKAADVGADLAGKIEQNIPEDDPRNPAVIADNVGDNVGDCAGMAADVFESYAVTLVAAILVAAWRTPETPLLQTYPLALGGTALLAGLVGGQFLWPGRSRQVGAALLRTVVISLILSAAGFWWLTRALEMPLALFEAALVGLGVGLGLVIDTAYFTALRFPPVRRIAQASCQGHATNIITGLAVGMKSAAFPALLVAGGVITAHQLAGIYGIAVATTALLALTPTIISMDAYGPVADNAGGIVEMAGLPESVRGGTDALDAAGNMTKALTKTFAIGSAGLAALALFAAYRLEFGVRGQGLVFSLDDPFVLGGVFCGSLLPFLFSGLALEAVGKAAGRVVEEARRQFRERPGILAGREAPDYAHAVAMLTRAAISNMLAPGLLPVAAPLTAALLAPWLPPGSMALLVGGMLMGAVASGLLLALAMSIGGGAWDNAKKYIEAGHYGGKGSPAHHAAVTGDTVGDPYKDTAGPAINPMAKVLSLMAVLLAPFLL